MAILLALHTGTTLFMLGLIWFVQAVHYPLFAAVGRKEFGSYARTHTGLTTLVVGPPMLVELVCGVLLVMWRPRLWPVWASWTGMVLLLVIWASTVFLQVPRHGELAGGFDSRSHRRLVATNWIRTLAWTARGGLVLCYTAMGGAG